MGSSSPPYPLPVFNLEVGRRLLWFARNMYFRQRSSKNLKYFYRYLLPQCCIILLFYFKQVSEAFQSPQEKCSIWNVARIKSLWLTETFEFKHHPFQLITRIVSADYARHVNIRRDFLPSTAHVPFMYTHTVVDETNLSKVFGKMGIVNGFFLWLGIFKGQHDMENLASQFHFSTCNPIFMQDLPCPDMQMLSFHTTMILIDGDFWKFASHFKHMYRQRLEVNTYLKHDKIPTCLQCEVEQLQDPIPCCYDREELEKENSPLEVA